MAVEPDVQNGIKVRAIQAGFYRQYRNVDDEFMIEKEQDFSKNWMVKLQPIDPDAPADVAPPPLVQENHDTEDEELRQKKTRRKKETEA
jgi:hypothetical protein